MKRRALTLSILIVHALAAATSSCSSDSDNVGWITNNENVAEAEQAVSRGTLAGINEYPYVGLLSGPNSFCSGILITPGWVLTANHCIFSWQIGSECLPFIDPVTPPPGEIGDYFFHLVNDPTGPNGSDTTRIFTHRFAASGPVRTLLGTTLDGCSADDASIDLALIRLDRRVPLNLVAPKHPPSGHCNAAPFLGTLVGFGPRDPITDLDRFKRNFTTWTDWELYHEQSGDLYRNGWVIAPNPVDPFFGFFGALSGDSGGALIDMATGNLCGVISRSYPVFGLPVIATDTAAVDSNAAKQFINSIIMDPAGNFLGECSTGPMGLRDFDADNDLIPDACDPCPDVPEPIADGVFLPIVDFDNDGVPDACDICPTIPNPRNILTHEQDDDDMDGIGNQCDLCPHSDDITGDKKVDDIVCCANDGDCGFGRCFPADAASTRFGHCATIGGRCEGSVDLDFDLIGESCDPCPGTFSPTFSDMDGDGVGDACDNCPGSPSAMHPEDLNDECDPADPLACRGAFPADSVCVPPHVWSGTTSTPRCTLIVDSELDPDGVGDRCDNCINRVNPFEGIGMQPNCNIHAEAKLGVPYPYIGDACDPNPCADLDVFTPPFCDPLGSCPAPAGGQWAKLAYSTNLLPGAKGGFPNPVLMQGDPPLATVGVRHCNCETFIGGNDALNVEDCDAPGACIIDATLYNSAGNWSAVQLVPSFDGPEAIPPASVAAFLPNAEYSPLRVVDPSDPIPPFNVALGFGDPGMFTDWANWFIPGLILNTPKQTELWSHVVNVTKVNVSPLFFQDEANHFEMGRFGLGLQTPPSGAYVILDPARWLDGPACPVCPQIPDVPNWAYDPSNGQIVIQGAIQVIDMTVRMPSLFGTLVGTIVDWVPVAESSNWVLLEAPRLAALSPDGTSVLGVFAPRNDHFVNVGSTTTAPLLPNAASAASPARSGFGSVLSAVDNALYVIGGFINATTPANDLWRFDVLSREWLQVPLNGPAPQRVLAATFRPEDRSLYVVDERKVGNGNIKRARLLRIDVGKRESTILADVPRQPHMNQVFLSHSPKGELLLVGSSSTTGRYMATRIAPQPNGTLLINKGFDGKGTIVREPTLTPRGVTLPMALPNGKVKNTFRYADDLHPGAFHPIGSCL